MRLSSLLLISLLAGAGCRTSKDPAAYPSAPSAAEGEGAGEGEGTDESAAEGGGAAKAAPGEPTEGQGKANPGEVPSDSPAPKAETPGGAQDRRTLLAGISLSTMGAASAGLGGFLLGWSMGACDSADTSCPTSVALPIVGALCIAGGAVPLMLGVSLWAPSVPTTKTGQASPWPEVTVGPAAASVKWRF
jgi:hypothetical protein